MQTYNSFNELATAQNASPLVSDMSVFNASAVTMEQAKEAVKEALAARKAYAAAMKRYEKLMNDAYESDEGHESPVFKYMDKYDSDICSSAF